MNSARRLYLQLEQQTLRLDEEGDEEMADRIRDLMDFVWFQRLSAEDRGVLNGRDSVTRDYLMDWLYEDPVEPATRTAYQRLESPVRGDVPYIDVPLNA